MSFNRIVMMQKEINVLESLITLYGFDRAIEIFCSYGK